MNGGASRERIRILLVEDDAVDCMAVERLIEREGLSYDLVVAGTVAEATDRLQGDSFDLALIDHQLPDGSGLEVQERAGQVPCIFVSGAADRAAAVQAMKAGAFDFVVKDSQREYLALLPAAIQATLARRRAEVQLELQRRMIDSLGEMVLLLDEAGDVVFANAAVGQVLGSAPEEVMGSAWWEVAFPDPVRRREMWAQAAARARGERPPASYDLKLPCRDGSRRWTAWVERRGPVGGLICVGRDITARAQAEEALHSALDELEGRVEERTADLAEANAALRDEIAERTRAEGALRESQAELSAIFDSAPVVMILVDRERRVRQVNRAAIESVGRPAGEMIGLRGGEALRCLHSLDDPRGCGFGPFCERCTVRRTVLDTFKTGQSFYQLEARLPLARGEKEEERELLVSTTLLDISEDQMVLVCIDDITDRVRAEESLRHQAYLLANVSDAIISSDMSFSVQSWNRTAEEIYGWRANEVIGKHFGDLVRPEYPYDQRDEVIEQFFADGYWKGEAIHRRKDGTPVHILGSVTLLKDDGGNPMGVVSANRDITERVRAERETKRRNEELAALNAIAAAVNRSLDLNQVLDAALEETLAMLNADGGLVYLFDRVSQTFAPAVHRGISPEILQQVTGFEMGQGLSGWVAESGQALAVGDLGADPRNISPAAAREGWRSYAGVPIKSRGQVSGVMTLVARQEGCFGADHVELLGHIGGQIGVAVEKARLYEAVQQELTERIRADRRQKLATRVLEVLNQPGNGTDEIRDILLLIQDFTGFEAVGIRLREEEDFPYYETSGFPASFVEAERYLCARHQDEGLVRDSEGNPFLECMCGNVICGRTDPSLPFFTENGSFWTNSTTKLLAATTEKERQAHTRNRCHGQGYESVALIPLRSESTTIGLLQLNDSRKGMFTLETIGFFERLGASIGIALARKQAADALRQRNRELALIHRAAQAFSSTLESDQVFATVLKEARHLLDVVACSVWLLEPETGELVCQQSIGSHSETVRGWRLGLGEGFAGWVARHGQSLIVPDTRADSRYFAGIDRQTGLELRSVASLPLRAKEDVIGVLQAVDTEVGRFNGGDLALLEPLAVSAAAAIENARLYQQAQQEIAERVRAEEALQESKDQLQSLFDNMLNGFAYHQIVTDEAGEPVDYVFLEVNETFERYTGLKRAEVIGRRVTEVYPGIEKMEFDWIGTYGQVALTGEPAAFEQCFEPQDRWYAISAYSPVKGYFAVVSEDITERKRAEEERALLVAHIREQAQHTRQIIDTVPEGVIVLDAARRVVLANPVARRDLAVLADVKVGDRLTRLGDRPLTELLTSPPKGLWHQVATNGSVFEVIARPLEVAPEPEGWVLVVRDVTQEREIQQRIQQQERLAAVGQLAAGIAHDFNNIMAVIVLYAQMSLRTSDLPPKIQDCLTTVYEQAHRATELIQQILDFSRRAVLERRPMDLVPFLKEQVRLLERILPESIKIELIFGLDKYRVNADPTRMQQTMMNLAVNARDAMPEGGHLHISLARLRIQGGESAPLPGMAAGEWVCLAVSDSGTGIPPDVRPRIFEPFFTTKASGKGSGLGLAQVYGIVTQHEGHIDVTTEVGEGTTFTLYLPAVETPGLKAVEPQASHIAKGQGEMVLVVEDDPAMRKALVVSLETLNYRPLAAADGREALAVFEEHRDEIALVLSDLVMPEMGGRSLLHSLRRLKSAVRVVMMTGHPVSEGIQDLWMKGIAGWLQKPVSLVQLAQVVSEALNKRVE